MTLLLKPEVRMLPFRCSGKTWVDWCFYLLHLMPPRARSRDAVVAEFAYMVNVGNALATGI